MYIKKKRKLTYSAYKLRHGAQNVKQVWYMAYGMCCLLGGSKGQNYHSLKICMEAILDAWWESGHELCDGMTGRGPLTGSSSVTPLELTLGDFKCPNRGGFSTFEALIMKLRDVTLVTFKCPNRSFRGSSALCS